MDENLRWGKRQMARALKTYVTNLGFFELAIAAPSMKAALEAWGMSHNAFQHGFAKQTDDADIIAATTAHPGVVLKRAVGSTGEFKEHAELPKTLPSLKPPRIDSPKTKTKAKAKERPKAKPEPKADRAAIISFEKARLRREKQQAEEEARLQKERAEKRKATDKAEAALEEAREAHEATMAAIESEQEKLNRRAQKERDRWDDQRGKLEEALKRARAT